MKTLIYIIVIILVACGESKNSIPKENDEDKKTGIGSPKNCSLSLSEEQKNLFVFNLDKNWEQFGRKQIKDCNEEQNKFLALMSATVFTTFKDMGIENVNENQGYSYWVLNMSNTDYCKPKYLTAQSLTDILNCQF